jgi:hypothetical protein
MMSHLLPVPPELEVLIEKRKHGERRKADRPCDEDRRKTARRETDADYAGPDAPAEPPSATE